MRTKHTYLKVLLRLLYKMLREMNSLANYCFIGSFSEPFSLCLLKFVCKPFGKGLASGFCLYIVPFSFPPLASPLLCSFLPALEGIS